MDMLVSRLPRIGVTAASGTFEITGRIGAGAIPVEDAMPLALQIAQALEAAPDQGVVYRELACHRDHGDAVIVGPVMVF